VSQEKTYTLCPVDGLAWAHGDAAEQSWPIDSIDTGITLFLEKLIFPVFSWDGDGAPN
jgi:hypothetical protein